MRGGGGEERKGEGEGGDVLRGILVRKQAAGDPEGSMLIALQILSRWEVPSLGARGTANLSPAAIAVTGSAPTFDLKGTAHLAAPDHQKVHVPNLPRI